jgi:hypothetical protein
VDEHFVDSYYPTIDATFEKDMKYKGKDYKLKIHDTAGQVSSNHFQDMMDLVGRSRLQSQSLFGTDNSTV